MIKIKYKALFILDFTHTFYKTGKCPDIKVQLSASCATLLKSLGLHFLPTDFGCKLYAKVNGDDKIKNPLPEGTKFTFLLKLKNNLFGNITDINLIKPADSHYYFNNLTVNLSLANEALLVANPTLKIVSDNDLMPFKTNSFSFADNNTAATETGQLNFIDSGESLQQTLTNSGNVFNYSFDLGKSTGGRAAFTIDGVEKATFFALEPQEAPGLFGIIEIFHKSTLPAQNLFQNTDHSINTKSYKIPFDSRATRWRYIVTKQFNLAVNGITVAKNNGTSIDFSMAAAPPSGKFIAVSNNALSLTEEPVTGIKLTDDTNKVIIANLPNPPLNLIKTEGSDTFSDILITI